MPIHVGVEDATVRILLLSAFSQLEIAPLQVEQLMESPALTHNAAAPVARLAATTHTAGAAAAKSAGVLLDLNGASVSSRRGLRSHLGCHLTKPVLVTVVNSVIIFYSLIN